MINDRITGKQMKSLYVMYWLGSLIVIGANSEVKQDYWIAILMTAVSILPMIALYCRLIKLFPDKDLFEIFFQIYGKVFGRVLSLIYILFALHLGSMVTRVFSVFIRIENLPETPEAVTTSVFLILAALLVSNGPVSIGRVAKYTWKFVIIFVLFATLIGLKDMNFGSLLPVMESDTKGILTASYYLFSLPFAESFILLPFFAVIDKSASALKIMLEALAIAIITILIVAVRNILILGVPATGLFFFPSYQAISIVSIGDFFSRFEVLVGVNLVLAGFIKVCVCLYTASLGLARTFHMDSQKGLVVPCALIIITVSQLLYSNVQELFDFIPFFVIYAVPFEIILPIITLAVAEIQHRLNSTNKPHGNQTEAANS